MTAIEAPLPVLRGPQTYPLSVKAYTALGEMGLIPEATELLYGQLYRKMSKSPLHSGLTRRLLRLLLDCAPAGCFVSQEQPITGEDSEPEPDLAVIRGREEDFWSPHPTTAELVVEICISSHEYDRSKLRAYAQIGVRECWLVLGPEQQIEVHWQPDGEQFAESTVHGPGGRLTSRAVPEFALDLAGLFAP